MTSRLQLVFCAHGYTEIAVNTAGIRFFIKQQNDPAAAAAVVETDKCQLSAGLISNIRRAAESFSPSYRKEGLHLLYILMTSGRISTAGLFEHDECFWILDKADCRLMQFENSDPLFDELVSDIENSLQDNAPESSSFLHGYHETDPSDDPVQTVPSEDGRYSDSIYENSSYTGAYSKKKRKITDIFPYIRTIPVTLAVIAVNLIVFLFTDLFSAGDETLFYKGCMSWKRVFTDHEYYRLVTSMFIHLNAEHIGGNMLSLLVLGAPLERAVGHLPYFILYMLSGICGGITSGLYYEYTAPDSVSAGASGAIFGVMGALLFMVIYYRGHMADVSFTQIAVIVAINLYYGLTTGGVDNSSHIGGLLSGFIICMFMEIFLHISKKYGHAAKKRQRRNKNGT